MVDFLRQNLARIEDETLQNIEVADLEGRVKEVLPSQLQYERLHWALTAIEHADEKCLSSLHEFIHGSLLNWTEGMRLLGEMPCAILMMWDRRVR